MNAQILVVEDDELLRDGLSELLSGEGYFADSCSGCEEAEKALKVKRYDLIILDVMLPDGSGYDLCRLFPYPVVDGAAGVAGVSCESESVLCDQLIEVSQCLFDCHMHYLLPL